ncbi:MAG TPA: helix-turn-helix transcriptional regulator [Pyrinomonadaceae bacterium]|nr:helix-turn-helix transcriptional regulator [Pyrinomonadaceae bacterium]
MGRATREKPVRLGEKLFQIREALGLSQNELLSRLGLSERLSRDDVSKYERGVREPSLLVLLRYARAAGVSTDVLIDDRLDLPAKLPAKAKHS